MNRNRLNGEKISMELEILGSGGSITTQKIFCNCPVCEEVREKNIFYRKELRKLSAGYLTISVYLTEMIASMFEDYLGIMNHFCFMEHSDVVELNIIGNDQIVDINGYQIQRYLLSVILYSVTAYTIHHSMLNILEEFQIFHRQLCADPNYKARINSSGYISLQKEYSI